MCCGVRLRQLIIYAYWSRFQSERESGDRNFAIGYYLKEKKVSISGSLWFIAPNHLYFSSHIPFTFCMLWLFWGHSHRTHFCFEKHETQAVEGGKTQGSKTCWTFNLCVVFLEWRVMREMRLCIFCSKHNGQRCLSSACLHKTEISTVEWKNIFYVNGSFVHLLPCFNLNFSWMQCFPDGTDMTAVLDLYFQVCTKMTSISELVRL